MGHKSAAATTVGIPVLGRINSGYPISMPASDFNYFDTEDAIEISESLLSPHANRRELFALEVLGNGLVEAFIEPGDLVILQTIPQDWKVPTVDAGEEDIVAVFFPGRSEIALTYLSWENDHYRMRGANSSMKPIIIQRTERLEVKGRVVLAIRRMEA